MVFARPVVLPLSIRGNLTYALELAGEKRKAILDEAEHAYIDAMIAMRDSQAAALSKVVTLYKSLGGGWE